MKTLERYVFSSFLASFLLSALVLTFVLTIGLLVQIVGFILDGVSAALIGKFALVSFPETLQWTIPLSLLVSGVLVFSRLSADSEIAAMRACGVHLLAVMRYPILFALACSAMGAWVNNEIVPRGHEVRRSLKTSVSVSTGLDVLEPGRWIDDFPKVKIYFGSKEGAWLKDLIVMDYSNPKIDRMIRASKALVTGNGRDVSLDLYGMTVDPIDENHPGMMRVSRYSYVVKDALEEKEYKKKIKDLRFRELLRSISDSYAQEKTAMERLFNLKKDGWAPAEAKAKFAADPEAKALRREIRRSRSKSKVELSNARNTGPEARVVHRHGDVASHSDVVLSRSSFDAEPSEELFHPPGIHHMGACGRVLRACGLFHEKASVEQRRIKCPAYTQRR